VPSIPPRATGCEQDKGDQDKALGHQAENRLPYWKRDHHPNPAAIEAPNKRPEVR
jgi:hypothetical protein